MSNSTKHSVFVRNLEPFTSDIDFVSYFQRKYANAVIGGRIVRDLNGRSKEYGFINLVDSSSVSGVLAEKNHIINGKEVICTAAFPKKRNGRLPKNFQKIEAEHLRKLYVGNLNVSTTNQQLKEYFQKFGTIVNAFVVFDENKRSKGYGFVEFQNSTSVEQVQEKRPHIINNREVQTVRSYPKNVPVHLRKPSTALYVLKYDETVDDDSIEEYFGNFGDITMISRKVKRPEDIKFMELLFDDYDAVDNICLANNHTINGCNVTVTKYLEDDLKKWNNAETKTQNPVRPAANSLPNNAKLNNNKNSTSEISKPSAPIQDYHRDPPFNPHFVHVPQQPLYPTIPPAPLTNLQSFTTSSSQRPNPRLRNAERVNNNDCVIL